MSEVRRASMGCHPPSPSDGLIALIDAYERPLYNFLVVLLDDREAARDCAQDAFLRAHEQWQHGRAVNAAWLYRVARNRAIDEMRRRKRVQTNLDAVESVSVPDTPMNEVIRAALAQLPSNDRELLYLFDVDGFDAREIAHMLGVSRGAVYVRLYRARERFRTIYRTIGGTQ